MSIPSTGPVAEDAVDAKVLDALRELGGDDEPGFFDGLLRTFLEHAERAVRELQGALAAGAREPARFVAHGLKGSAGNVGARPLALLAAAVEAAASTPGADLAPGVRAIASEVVRVRRRLEREMHPAEPKRGPEGAA